MTRPQPGIFAEGSTAHYALEYTVGGDGAALAAALRQARADAGGTNMVLAFSGSAWSSLGGSAPAGLRGFDQLGSAPGPTAPATQRDLLVWRHGDTISAVDDAALAAGRAMAPVGTPDLDLRGFTYHDSRDLIGFVDGTANPKGDARMEAALIPDGNGGAFAMSQQWVHDLDSFNALPVAEQEGVVGRTKPDSIELEGDAMPADSHVSRTDVKIDGVAQKIWRRSFPYGDTSTKGLYFLSFACDLARFDVQLQRMYGVSGDGLKDRITEFSAAITGSYWYAPSEDDLAAALGG